MNSEFELYQQAAYLSEHMLQALSAGDVTTLTQFATQREDILNQIHQQLQTKTSLPAEQVELLKELLALNEQLVATVYEKRQSVGEELKLLHIGKKAKALYRKQG